MDKMPTHIPRPVAVTSGIGRRRPLGALVGVVCAWLSLHALVPTAAAQPSDSAQAREHFETATHAFQDGDYTLAIQEFQAAYDLTQHPDLLFNIYSAAERAGRLEDAERALAMYLELGRPGRQRRALTNRLARLRRRVAEMRAAQPPPPPPTVAPEPEPAPVVVAEVAPPTPEPAAPASPPASSSGLPVHPAAIGTLIGAGVLFASFGIFAGLSEAEDQSLASRCGRDAGAMCSPGEVGALATYNVIADASWITGAVAAVAGLVLLFVLPPEETPTIAIAPWATPYAAGASAVTRW